MNTTAQISLAAVVLGELGFDIVLGFVSEALVYIVVATTLLSGAAYVIKWGRLAITMEQDQ